MPAPRAENVARSLTTAAVSRISMGRRFDPRYEATIRDSALVC